MNVYYDSPVSDAARRDELFQGAAFVYTSRQAALKLCDLARELIEDAFGGDPQRIHETMPVEQCVEVLSKLKPQFIHHPKAKEYIPELLEDLDCSVERTYFDTPRLRTAFPGDYLKSGIAYAFHPHRDTWYSAPLCQINWWIPVYDIRPDNAMAFHPQYFSRPVRNGSAGYNYQEWSRQNRFSAAQHVKSDTRVQPKPEEPLELQPDVRLLPPPGGIILFSGAQLHSTVPNTSPFTRYSIDFRTVHLDDVLSRHGALNVDSACTGTPMGDYLRGKDLSHLPSEVLELYDAGTPLAVR